MALATIPGYTVKKGPGGIPIYTPVAKPAAKPPVVGGGYTSPQKPILGPDEGYIPGTAIGGNPNASQPSQPAVTQAAPAAKKGFWNIPDYDALLAGDWEPGEAAIRGKELTDARRAQFAKAFKTAYTDWGGDPTKVPTEFRQYLDDATIEEGRANKFSAMAQNLAAMKRNLTNQDAQNEARGMATSGRSVTQARTGLEEKERADWGDYRTFLGGAEEGLIGISEADRQANDWIREARSRAAARIAQENPRTWEPGDEEQSYIDSILSGNPVPEQGYNAPAPVTPAVAKPVLRWGGNDIYTKAQLKAALGYNQNLTTWRNQHPGLWEKLA